LPYRGLFHLPRGGKAGKLIGAAKYWAGGVEIDETEEDAKLFGLEMPKRKQVTDYEVIPEAWPAVVMFIRVQTQWRISSSAIVGLDYSAVRWMFEIYNVEDPRTLLEDLQMIEATVVETLNQREK